MYLLMLEIVCRPQIGDILGGLAVEMGYGKSKSKKVRERSKKVKE